MIPASKPLVRPLRGLLLGAALLLGACGDSLQAPAALVDGARISEATLERRLDAVLTDPGVAARIRGPDGAQVRRDLTREILGFLIRLEVVEAYARAHGITVSEAEIDEALAPTVERLGGQAAFEAELQRRGLRLESVRENVRENLLLREVGQAVARERLGVPGATDPAQAERSFSEWLEERLREAEIEVNPRFGRFDPERGTVCRIASTAGDLVCPQSG